MNNNVIKLIDTVIKSCEQGYTGEWDTSTDEGREAFNDMSELLERAKKLLIGVTK